MDLNGKVAIVTGGARGIGFAYCKALLEKNAKVCIADIRTREGETAVRTLEEKYGKGKIIFVKCDVTKEEEFENVFIVCKSSFGDRVDILVNNAGICDETKWQRMIDINIKGVVTGIHLAFKYLGKEGDECRGVVVNTASIAGVLPFPPTSVYVGAKHAVIGITRSYGDPFSFKYHKVKVNSICPGKTETSFLNEVKHDLAMPKEDYENILSSFPSMSTDVPAKALIKILEEGKNGSCIFIGSSTQVDYIDFPNYMHLLA